MNTDFCRAYLLHRRPYSDSQWLLDMLVEGVGQIRLLARISGKQAIKQKAQLQPFHPLILQYAGRGDLKYLNRFELADRAHGLSGRQLYCGFYLNELCNRIIPVNEPVELAFDLYREHLDALTQGAALEGTLRGFEFSLLELLGYGIDFHYDAHGEGLKTGSVYQYFSEAGWLEQPPGSHGFTGLELTAIAEGAFDDPRIAYLAKQLSRYLLKPLLGSKPLKSRELFITR